MPKIKGTDVVSLREIFRAAGGDREKDFVAGLAPDLEKLYKTALAITWSPLDQQVALFEAAAKFLYPNAPIPIRELGAAMARKTYGGIYRIFLRIPKLEHIIGQAAHMWRTYYDQGRASVENFRDHLSEFVVRDFPELPLSLRESIAGNLTVILEYTGAKNVRVAVDSDHPDAWTWHVRWD